MPSPDRMADERVIVGGQFQPFNVVFGTTCGQSGGLGRDPLKRPRGVRTPRIIASEPFKERTSHSISYRRQPLLMNRGKRQPLAHR